MNATSSKWIDLTRYGSRLQILPKSSARTAPIAVLTIYDQNPLIDAHGHESAGDMDAARQASLKRAHGALEAMGFGTTPKHLPFDESTGQRALRFYSLRTRFTLDDMRPLFPGIDASDVRSVPLRDIVIDPELDSEATEAWAGWFAHAEATAAPVWVPAESPHTSVYAGATGIAQADPTRRPGEPTHRLFGKGRLVPGRVVETLDQAQYREDGLIAFYLNKESALADGHSEHQLTQTTLPHALPLWIAPSGRVTALRDLRVAKEVLADDPTATLGRQVEEAMGALRSAPAVRKVLEQEVSRWAAWSAHGGLDDAATLQSSLQRVLETLCENHRRHQVVSLYVGSLIDGWKGSEEDLRSPVMKPIASVEESDMWDLARQLVRFGVNDVSDPTVLLPMIKGAFARAHELLQEEIREAARAQLQELASTAGSGADDGLAADDGRRMRHEDAGEHIGGARKDFAKYAMTVADLDSMNQAERESLVSKKNVWPPLNYAAMREDGVSADVAYAIKILKDTLAVSPMRRGRFSDREDGAAERAYIEAIGLVRDRLAEIRTIDDLRQACYDLYKAGTMEGDFCHDHAIAGCTSRQQQWGDKFSFLVAEGNAHDSPSIPYKVMKELRRKVGSDPTNWSALIKPKREKSDARKEADAERQQIDRELHRPHLEHVQREGEDWRRGRDVDANDLIEHFGFRAVEFGNWLPQDERQDVLNMAFDSFADLAQALDLPPKAMSIGGSLAIAFGSRGRGGRNAALAHYESDRTVINLTRMKGAGALAHEWFHGMDFDAGNGTSAIENARPGTVMYDLLAAMCTVPTTAEALLEKAWANASRGKDNANSWLYLQPIEDRPRLKEINESLFQQAYDHMMGYAGRAIEGFCKNGSNLRAGCVPVSAHADLLDKVMTELKSACPNKPGFTKVKSKIEQNVHYFLHQLSIACTVEAAQSAGLNLPEAFLGRQNAEPSDYMANARKLDKLRSSPYWATGKELFARAGAAYIHDRLAARGQRNDYLVFGSEEGRHSDNAYGNPNPTGAEREVLAVHFAKLMDEYRLTQSVEPSPSPGTSG